MPKKTMKSAAGIIVGVREHGNVAVLLQKRKDDDRFARGSQVTAHGKLEESELALPPNERFRVAMLRKVLHELGVKMRDFVAANDDRIVELNHEIRADKEVVTFGLDSNMPADIMLDMVELGGDAGGVFVCSDPSKIRAYRNGERESGVPEGEIAMFPDEILSVEKFFEHFK